LIAVLALLATPLAIPPSLSALCPKPLPGEIVVCADSEPRKSPYRAPLKVPPERGTKNSISVSRERNALFDHDSGGAGSCSASGLAGNYGCGTKAHKAWVEQRAGSRSGGGRIYDRPPE
jgi:hypothetical protein